MNHNSYDGELLTVTPFQYIYRVKHRIMEGDCQYDHGPRKAVGCALQVARYPVTNRQYAIFLEQSGYQPTDPTNFLRHWKDGSCPADLLEHPVVWISQNDAKAFAAYYGMRLPYDFEWQYLAGGAQKLTYPWGDTFDSACCSTQQLMPVDAFPEGASPLGCEDMCGNAWEWVEDIIDDGMHLFTFLRGGSYYKAPHFWHAEGGPHSNDYHLKMPLLNEGINRNATVGFRCVKETGCNL